MNSNKIFRYLSLIVSGWMVWFSSAVLVAQTTYTINTDDSRIWVEGTSTLKDWTAEVHEWEGMITLNEDGEVEEVSITMDVNSMDGGRGEDMNAKIYKALKSSEHPFMTFKGTGAMPDEGNDLATTGTFEMAGKTQMMKIEAKGSVDDRLTGKYPMKLSMFEIDPPTAMFGAIVTHDDVAIVFDISLNKKM